MKKYLLLLIAVLVISTSQVVFAAEKNSNDQLSVYFGPTELGASDDLEQVIINFIQNTTETLDIAVHELDDPKIVTALVNQCQKIRQINKARPIKVRIVLENDYIKEYPEDDPRFEKYKINRDIYAQLKKINDNNLEVQTDTNPSLMHAKFIIRDAGLETAAVLVSSANFTTSGTHSNYNNIVIIKDKRVADTFRKEFLEFWRGEYGLANLEVTRKSLFRLKDDIVIETLFSPEDVTVNDFVSKILTAKKSISFMVFAFSSKDMIDAINSRMDKGVKVSGIFDRRLAAQGWSPDEDFSNKGADIALKGLVGKGGKLHHKVVIIDNEIVITGSSNLSHAGMSNNDESVLVIHSESVAKAFYKEFERIRRYSEKVSPSYEMRKKDAKRQLKKLIAFYEGDKKYFDSFKFDEHKTRTDLIDTLFEILGWDISNRRDVHYHLREVEEEDKLYFEGGNKRVDYSLRLNGRNVLFVEAKAAYANLEAKKGEQRYGSREKYYFQAKRYGWSSSAVDIAVLTNFKQFRVFDCTKKPELNRPDVGLIEKFSLDYTDYLANFDVLYDTFSREAVLGGSLDRLLDVKHKRRPMEIDFLKDINKLRLRLAQDIWDNNKLTVDELNEVSQRIFDRIFFLRICEDRDILRSRAIYDTLSGWSKQQGDKKKPLYDYLNKTFSYYQKAFGGILFDPHFCEQLKVSDKTLEEVIRSLYYPQSPYVLNEISVELIGRTYESFLAYKLEVDVNGKVKRSAKPEVRRSGGVFYTPTPLVDYVVSKTVRAKLSKCLSLREIASVKVIDPVCGCGVFLLSAYKAIIDYTINYYRHNPHQIKGKDTPFPDCYQLDSGEWKLSIHKKLEILQNNLYGIDVDPQAIEATIMCLYMRALENEASFILGRDINLPSLRRNFINGNALVGTDIQLTREERQEIKPFHWNDPVDGFGNILQDGGFDCVIGNPPYLSTGDMRRIIPRELDYIKGHYETAKQGRIDLYIPFVEKGYNILRENGLFGMVLSDKFIVANYGEKLRSLITTEKALKEIVVFNSVDLFSKASLIPCMLFLTKKPTDTFSWTRAKDPTRFGRYARRAQMDNEFENEFIEFRNYEIKEFTGDEWVFLNVIEKSIYTKLQSNPKIKDVVKDVFKGSDASWFIFEIEKRTKDGLITVRSSKTKKTYQIERKAFLSYVRGQDIEHYIADEKKVLLLFPYEKQGGKITLIDWKRYKRIYPKAASYLLEIRESLSKRAEVQGKLERWYGYSHLRNLQYTFTPKIICRFLSERFKCSLDLTGRISMTSNSQGIIFFNKLGLDPHYILAVLNHPITSFYINSTTTKFSEKSHLYHVNDIENLSIYTDFSTKPKRKIHEQIVEDTKSLIKLLKKSGQEKEAKKLQKKINKAIYNLPQ